MAKTKAHGKNHDNFWREGLAKLRPMASSFFGSRLNA